jgi:hypothetical protein
MHGLETGTSLGELVGGMVSFVGFGQHQVQIALSGTTDCLISVEGDYRVGDTAGRLKTYRDAVAGAAALLSLLGHIVQSATVPDAGTVRIDFDDGSVIELVDSSSQYESYQLHLGDRLIVV